MRRINDDHFDEMPKTIKFPSSQALIADIKERSDDLEKVVIIPPGTWKVLNGRLVGMAGEFQLMLCMVGGDRYEIGQTDATLLLEDGILERMDIKVEWLNGRA